MTADHAGQTGGEREVCGHVQMFGKLPVTCRAAVAPARVCLLGHVAPAPSPVVASREAAVEAVARALHDDDCDCEEWPCYDGWDRKYRRLAKVAVAALSAGQDGAR